MKTIEVTGCKDCNFCQSGCINYCTQDEFTCLVEGIEIRKTRAGYPITPSWCPLKQGPVTVKMKEE